MNENDDDLIPIGKHRIRIDGDSVYFLSRGILTFEEFKLLMQHYARIRSEYGMLFVFFDSRGSTGMEPSVRNFNPHDDRKLYVADLQVAFGGSFALRVMLTMMNRANNILRRHRTPIQMFEQEDEAWQFFQNERERIRKEFGNKGNTGSKPQP